MNKTQKNPKCRILILGLGNPLMGDDGIGVILAKELKKLKWPPGLRILDVGTSVFYYLGEISQARQVIAIDAFQAGGYPGCVYRLDIEDVADFPEQDAHGMSLPGIIKLARSITGLPEAITIYGVEPEKLDFGQGLTFVVKSTVPKIISLLKTEVQEIIKKSWGQVP